jgi:hypothetical protein
MTASSDASPLIGITGARIRGSRIAGMPDILHGDYLDYTTLPTRRRSRRRAALRSRSRARPTRTSWSAGSTAS